MRQVISRQTNLTNYNKVIAIIEEVSPKRRYQTILFIFFLALFFSLHLAGSTDAFLFSNPVFKCGNSNKIVQEKDACPIIETCTIQNYYTLTAHLHLYCGQQKNNRNFIKSIKGAGLWVGIGLVALGVNRFGKKPFIKLGVVFLNLWFIFLFVGSFLNSNILLSMSYFCFGVGNSIVESISFIYITRFLPKQSYERLTVAFFFVGSGVAQLVFGLVTSIIQSWLTLLIIVSVPIFCLFALSFLLQEDPYYLFEKSRITECKKVIRFIGQFNSTSQIKIEEQLILLGQLQSSSQNIQVSFTQVVHILKLNLNILWLVIVLGVTYLSVHVSEQSFNYIAREIGFSYQSNISILGAASIIGNFTFFFIISLEDKRKRGFVWATIIEILLSFLFLTQFINDSKFLQASLLFSIKFLKNWSINFYTRLKVDCLPKRYQTSLMTGILLIGKTAESVSPSIIQYYSDHHLNVMVMNNLLMFFFGVCLILLIKQKNHEISLTKPTQQSLLTTSNQSLIQAT